MKAPVLRCRGTRSGSARPSNSTPPSRSSGHHGPETGPVPDGRPACGRRLARLDPVVRACAQWGQPVWREDETSMDTDKRVTKRRGLGVALLAALLALALFAPSAGAQVFSNQTLIKIPATGTQGPAQPYPSPITVSGMTGAVTSVTATITGFGHTW